MGLTVGYTGDRRAVTADLEAAVQQAWPRAAPLYVGKFGALHAADEDDRAEWTTWVRRELERLDLPWA
ncbi:hypothetical protein [Microbacterium pygmaeum]|uniref:hypothetical protein n=1 Tax=Microbacterium pygmaeum TaxID=370764 RepID=UPI0012F811E3|nr:hypothetical protein [Microbacterium pygmaeum]